ncbi:MAG: LPXTG cell wall anchor domain-containing protein [Enterococcus sp.]
MENEIHIEGYLGSADQPPSESAGKESEHKTAQVTNVQVTRAYPQTGESQNHYLMFSGLCLLLLLLVVKSKRTTKS